MQPASGLNLSDFQLTKSQARSLLSIAKLKRAGPRLSPRNSSLTLIAQTSLGLSGRFCPMIRPLFHGAVLWSGKFATFCHGHGRLLTSRPHPPQHQHRAGEYW